MASAFKEKRVSTRLARLKETNETKRPSQTTTKEMNSTL